MAQLVVAAAGAAIGGMLAPGIVAFGMTGASLGWMAGSMLGSAFAPTQKSSGPQLSDLSVSTSAYGTPIPYVQGHPRIAGQIVWASTKREIATTEEVGKGGGGAEYTSYTYEVDLLILLTDNIIEGVSRVWSNGELIFDGAVSNNAWTRLTAYTGAASQLPDPTYEAAAGTANAPAYRGRGSVFIESLQLGGSGQIPNLTFEIGTSNSAQVLLHLTGDDLQDSSGFNRSVTFVQANNWASSTLDEPTAPKPVDGAFGGSAIAFQRRNTSYIEVDTDGWFPETGDFSIEFRFKLTQWEATTQYAGLNTGLFLYTVGSSGQELNQCNVRPAFAYGTLGVYVFGTAGGRLDNSWQHAVVQKDNGITRIGVNGQWLGLFGSSFSGTKKIRFGNFYYQTGIQVTGAISGAIEELRIVTGVSYVYNGVGSTYAVPQATHTGTVGSYKVTDGVLSSTVTNLCALSGLAPAQFDVTALSAITRPVRSMAISSVSSARTVLDMLAASYHFEAVLSDKIYFRPRASAPAATLTFNELGVVVDSGGTPDPLPLTQANELEIPAQMALTYSNVDGDYQTDTQYSDRLLTGQESTSAMQVPLGFTSSEAKQVVDAMLLDKAVSALTTSVSLGVTRAELEPTDVVLLTGEDGSSYRMRIVKKAEASGVTTLECVQDDSTVFTQTGATAGGTASQTTVLATPTTALELLDVPLLRDVDNLPGHYVAVKGSAANWTSAGLYDSLDDLTYTPNATISSQAVMGACTTALADWAGGNVFDEVSSVTVNVGAQQLASVTRDDILASQSTNAALIGAEVLQYRTAALVSAGVYTLSGFLRGQRGTASTGHSASDRFIVLASGGLRFIPLQQGDLGRLRYYKAASAGQKLSAVTSQSLTPAGITLKPFAPVDARANRDTADTVLTWIRQTRLSTRIVGTLGISSPLGEAAESYEVEIYTAGHATLLRTLTSSTPSVTYTSAQQVTDFGAGQSAIAVKIYQISATVGRGTPLITTV